MRAPEVFHFSFCFLCTRPHRFYTHRFFFSISTALGLLNIIPCYYLDGQYAFEVSAGVCCIASKDPVKVVTEIGLKINRIRYKLYVCMR